MLVWNKSDDLKNGSVGVFTGVRGDYLLVFFEGVGEVEITRQTWIKRSRSGQKAGSVTQFPLVLAYAVTCHKSQGLTLASAIVHCSREYVSGLIYVAVSRVRSPEHIHILDFSPRQLLKPQRKAVDICTSQHLNAPVADLSCCRNKSFNDDTLLSVKDRGFQDCEEDDEPFTFPSELLDGPVLASFEDESIAIPMELLEIYQQLLSHESILASPPAEDMMKFRNLLTSFKASNAVSSFVEEMNNAIDFLLNESSSIKVQSFVKLVWFHSFLMVENHVVENPDEIVVDIGRQGFTGVTSTLHEFFTSSDFSRYVCALFDARASTPPQRAIAVKLSTSVHWEFLEKLVSVVGQQRHEEPIPFDVEQMSGVGRSKVRHVGGWAVRKVLTRARKYIQRNVYTKSSSTLATVENQQIVCQLLEENVIQPYTELEETSKFLETLEVTEARQYRERGLLHISDQAYLFFIQLEKRRVELLNLQILKRVRDDMVEIAITELRGDNELKANWLKCFEEDDIGKHKELIEKLLADLLMYYVNMGACQFLRDFRRECQVKKSVELRKRVLQRQERNQEKTDSVPFQEILRDRSENKKVSHGRLVAFIHKHPGTTSLSRVFIKTQLVTLCEAYNIRVSARSTKTVLAEALLNAITQHTSIPFTSPVDDRIFRVAERSESDGHIRIRLSRAKKLKKLVSLELKECIEERPY
ncbi:hypothetical protein OS493_038316 [Desmophyllum pertusum]|uniref:ATP-dependent DNA helicase PIF1 n=1 Tax=Desmophyllum pertusum TaxID=174260 RepID=A0A9X0CHM6_9CNID|nr:hypothetical protein OS493_038316 [Desmophyllum pertusum]